MSDLAVRAHAREMYLSVENPAECKLKDSKGIRFDLVFRRESDGAVIFRSPGWRMGADCKLLLPSRKAGRSWFNVVELGSLPGLSDTVVTMALELQKKFVGSGEAVIPEIKQF